MVRGALRGPRSRRPAGARARLLRRGARPRRAASRPLRRARGRRDPREAGADGGGEMIAASLAIALALGAPDPCAPVEVARAPDPGAAESYRAVGDAERAAGSHDTAAAAYRAALALDPADARSRAALALLCAEEARDGAFERGLRRMQAGDRRAAIVAFDEARAARADRSAALLEGICFYELGEDERARPLLSEAEADPAHRNAARLFLGLVALRAGRSADATALLEAAAADHRLGPAALDLARLARRDGRVVVSVLLDATFDSNVDLTPDRTADLTREGDASGGATVLLRVAPWGDSGPFVRGTAVLRNQARYDALDLGGGGVAAGWQAGRGGGYLLGEASWDYRELGGAPYLSAPRLLGAARPDGGHGRSVGPGSLRGPVDGARAGARRALDAARRARRAQGLLQRSGLRLHEVRPDDRDRLHRRDPLMSRALAPILAAFLGLAGSLAATVALHRAGAAALDRVLEERLLGAGETAARLLGEGTASAARLRDVMEANRLEGAYVVCRRHSS